MNILITSLEGFFAYDLDTQTLVTINDVPCFGITQKNDRYYLFIHSPFGEKFSNPINKDIVYNKGKIISFTLNGTIMEDIRDEIGDIDYKTHQITFMNDDLIIQETYQQRFTIYNTINGTSYAQQAFPQQYFHMNAVEYYDEKIFVLAPHIHAVPRTPKLYILDTSFNTQEEILLPGDILHGIHLENNIVTYLCSSGKIYQYDYVNKVIVDTYDFTVVHEKWMRGLIVHQDYFIVGCGKTIQKIDRVTREITVYPLNIMCFPCDLLVL